MRQKKTLLFASTNTAKIKEIQGLLPEYNILSLLDFPEIDDVEETAADIKGNAKLKAEEVAKKVDLPVFSDDTGFFVDELDGFPGVHSARFTGEHRAYDKQNEYIIEALEGKTNRNAHYETVVAFCRKGYSTQFFEGKMDLVVAEKESETEGFSYDTIVKTLEGNYVSELPSDEKAKLSSRGKAIMAFRRYLTTTKTEYWAGESS